MRTTAALHHASVDDNSTVVDASSAAQLWLLAVLGHSRSSKDLVLATLDATSRCNGWGQPCMGPLGAQELHLGSHSWSFAGLKPEESKQCFPWVGRGQCLSSHAQRAPLRQERLRESMGSSVSRGTVQQHPPHLGSAREPKEPVRPPRQRPLGKATTNLLCCDFPFFIMFDIFETELCYRLLAYGSRLGR